MSSLDSSDIGKITTAISPWIPSAVAAVKIYFADGGQWVDVNTVGALTFFENTDKDTNYLYLIDLVSGNPVWSQEMYQPFQYFSPTKFFHTLETDDTVVGLSFAEEAEALSFFQTVMIRARDVGLMNSDTKKKKTNKSSMTSKFVPKISKPKMPVMPNAPHVSFKPLSNSISQTSGMMKKMMKNIGKTKDDESTEPIIFEISSPQNFKHESHLEWTPGQPIDPDNLPPEWKKLFQAAGVRKKDLLNPETVDVVMGIVTQAMGGNTSPQPAAAAAPPPPPPPPPPPGGSRPPPPSQNNNPPPTPPPTNAPSGGGGLLDEIQKGKALKKVEVGPIGNLNQDETNSLAVTLAKAMQNIRYDLTDKADNDDDWSE
jgi:Wiskott-Aldrich syndrome protein